MKNNDFPTVRRLCLLGVSVSHFSICSSEDSCTVQPAAALRLLWLPFVKWPQKPRVYSARNEHSKDKYCVRIILKTMLASGII